MNLFRWFQWFNPSKITWLIASFALVMGARQPWYRLPLPTLETFGTNLNLAIAGRAIAAVFALLGFAFTLGFKPSRAARLLFWNGLIIVLLFPYFLTTWSPSVAYLAKAFYNQGERVTIHIGRNFPEVQSQWKQNVSLEASLPITSTFNLPIPDSRFFQISAWDKFLLEYLGYNNSFFGLIGRGWGFTVIGLTFGLLALYVGLENNNLNALTTDWIMLLPWASLGLGILVFYLIIPNIVNYQLDTLFAKGQYHQVLTISRTLAAWYPPVSGDEKFLQRLGEAGFYGNEPDEALINFVKGLERYRLGDLLQAETYFQQSLAIQPNRFLVRGYLATTIINQGVNFLNDSNSRKPGAATDRFTAALQVFPGHVQALYYLMLARVINGELEKSASVAQQILEIDGYAQQPNIALRGQAYLHSAWASYSNDKITTAWAKYRQSVDSSAWKKSVQEGQ